MFAATCSLAEAGIGRATERRSSKENLKKNNIGFLFGIDIFAFTNLGISWGGGGVKFFFDIAFIYSLLVDTRGKLEVMGGWWELD